MKKTIVAVMVAASAVLSAQAMAANTAEVTVLGEVNDSSTSCVVTPSVTTSEANAQTANTLFKSQKFGFDVSDCAKGSDKPATGLTVAVTGTTSTNATILDNTADDGAAGIGIGIAKVSDGSRVAFDGSQTMDETYTDGEVTSLNYYAGYVKVNDATTVTEGPVKGVATFTIDYTSADA